jgi:thiamine biosynthesis lipoprotein
MRLPRWARAGALAVLAVLGACGSPSPAPPPSGAKVFERTGLAMGSELALSAWSGDEAAVTAAFDAVFHEFDRLDSLMSVWRSGSDVVRLNQAAGEHPVPVSPETIEVFDAARTISEWTGGKFDVTFGALSDLWRFDQDQDNRIPDPREVRLRLPLIDYRALVVDPTRGTAYLQKRGMRVHLGGIGKGYAVERAAKIFRDHGVENFLIQAGGDLYVGGLEDGRPWRIGINDPRGRGGDSFAALDLSNATFSTSGDYERFFVKDGVRYHHLLDPATGEPARGCRSVTIVAPSPTLADGLSTGVFIMGPVKGMALIEKLPGVEGVIVTAKNEVLVSSGLKGKLMLRHDPTDAP